MPDLERARAMMRNYPPTLTEITDALTAARREGAEEMRERAARLHENIDPACDHERQNGTPGAAAMGAIIRYRDAIRALKGEH